MGIESLLPQAAIEVTRITTGQDPPKRQPVFGPRSVDIVFGTQLGNVKGFDLAEFFGEKPPIRWETKITPIIELSCLWMNNCVMTNLEIS